MSNEPECRGDVTSASKKITGGFLYFHRNEKDLIISEIISLKRS